MSQKESQYQHPCFLPSANLSSRKPQGRIDDRRHLSCDAPQWSGAKGITAETVVDPGDELRDFTNLRAVAGTVAPAEGHGNTATGRREPSQPASKRHLERKHVGTIFGNQTSAPTAPATEGQEMKLSKHVQTFSYGLTVCGTKFCNQTLRNHSTLHGRPHSSPTSP